VASQQQGGLAARLEPVVQRAVEEVGYDLELLDVQPAGRRRLVKVVVDGEHGIGLDAVATVSRAVSTALDARDDLLAGPYTLEVTSPGVDRPLVRPRHWRRAWSRLVRVRLVDGTQFTGRVGVADTTGVEMLVDGRLRRVAYDAVDRAVVEVEFRRPPAEELAVLERGTAHNSTGDNSTGENSADREDAAAAGRHGNEEESR
jgi:ribosome maturation factor RimP